MGRGGYNGGSTVIHAGSGWFGKGSVTSQPSEKKKRGSAASTKSRRKKNKSKQVASRKPSKGNGLTIPEMIARAEKKVRSISSEIANTKKRLAALERDLEKAKAQVDAARNTPRRTALGNAILAAQKAKGDKNTRGQAS